MSSYMLRTLEGFYLSSNVAFFYNSSVLPPDPSLVHQPPTDTSQLSPWLPLLSNNIHPVASCIFVILIFISKRKASDLTCEPPVKLRIKLGRVEADRLDDDTDKTAESLETTLRNLQSDFALLSLNDTGEITGDQPETIAPDRSVAQQLGEAITDIQKLRTAIKNQGKDFTLAINIIGNETENETCKE